MKMTNGITGTIRYCIVCKKNTMFNYNRNINHSECKICKSRFAKHRKEGFYYINIILKIIDKRRQALISGKNSLYAKKDLENQQMRIIELNKIMKIIKESIEEQ